MITISNFQTSWNLTVPTLLTRPCMQKVGWSLFPHVSLVLCMSFKIRYNKAVLEKYPRVWLCLFSRFFSDKVNNLRAATESLVQRRMRLLRRLRAFNKDDYRKAMDALKINEVVFLDPFDVGEGSEADKKKKAAKESFYQVILLNLLYQLVL